MNKNGERTVNRMESWEYDMSEKNTPGVVDVGHTTGDRPTAGFLTPSQHQERVLL
jgi:hypothetical protein